MPLKFSEGPGRLASAISIASQNWPTPIKKHTHTNFWDQYRLATTLVPEFFLAGISRHDFCFTARASDLVVNSVPTLGPSILMTPSSPVQVENSAVGGVFFSAYKLWMSVKELDLMYCNPNLDVHIPAYWSLDIDSFPEKRGNSLWKSLEGKAIDQYIPEPPPSYTRVTRSPLSNPNGWPCQ